MRRAWRSAKQLGIIASQRSDIVISMIHANPVRRGLVQRAIDWEYSSDRWYAGIRPVPIEMDRTIPMLHG